MSWREVWREHVIKTGDFWVDRWPGRDQWLDEKEWGQLLKKKELIHSRQAQIIKSTINGSAFNHHNMDDEDYIHYREHLALLIKHKDQSYLEEQAFDKEIIFQGETLKGERLVGNEGIMDEDLQLDLSDTLVKQERFSYDRDAAVSYAEEWWNDYNPDYPKFDVDCTNYVSQCLKAGGAPMTHIGEKAKGWWCKGKACSYSWSVANALKVYLSSEGNSLNAILVDEPEQLVPGDIICYDWEGDNKWNHNTIVVAKDWDDMPLVNAHTINSRNRYWSYEDSPAFTENTQYYFFHIDAD